MEEEVFLPETEEEKELLARQLFREGYGKEEYRVALLFKEYFQELSGQALDLHLKKAIELGLLHLIELMIRPKTNFYQLIRWAKDSNREDLVQFLEELKDYKK